MGIQRQTETKAIGFQGVGFDDVEGTLEGFAAVYGNWDRANEVIEPGACAKTIQERKAKVPMGLDHLHGFGVTEDLQEVGRADLPASIRNEYPDATGGLYCKGRVVLSDENVRRLDLIRQRSAAGQPVGMSITYRVMRETPGQTPTGAKGRRLQELALHEWGPQLSLRPVNPAAMVTEAKASGDGIGSGAKGMAIPGSDEAKRERLVDAVRQSGLFPTGDGAYMYISAVLPDSIIVEYQAPNDCAHSYRVTYASIGDRVVFGDVAEVEILPTVVEKADNIAGLQSIVDMAATQMKAGAVLSAANLTLVEAAIEALTALRAAARKESAGDTGAKGDEPDAPVSPAAPDAAMPRTDWGFRLRLAEAVAAHASQRLAMLPRAI